MTICRLQQNVCSWGISAEHGYGHPILLEAGASVNPKNDDTGLNGLKHKSISCANRVLINRLNFRNLTVIILKKLRRKTASVEIVRGQEQVALHWHRSQLVTNPTSLFQSLLSGSRKILGNKSRLSTGAVSPWLKGRLCKHTDLLGVAFDVIHEKDPLNVSPYMSSEALSLMGDSIADSPSWQTTFGLVRPETPTLLLAVHVYIVRCWRRTSSTGGCRISDPKSDGVGGSAFGQRCQRGAPSIITGVPVIACWRGGGRFQGIPVHSVGTQSV